jgi:hypothetical protein
LTIGDGIWLGALTGLCAGALGFGLSFLGLAGFQGMANDLAQMLPAEDMQGLESVPTWGILLFNLLGVLTNVIFGTIGGWIGGAIFRTDRHAVVAGA